MKIVRDGGQDESKLAKLIMKITLERCAFNSLFPNLAKLACKNKTYKAVDGVARYLVDVAKKEASENETQWNEQAIAEEAKKLIQRYEEKRTKLVRLEMEDEEDAWYAKGMGNDEEEITAVVLLGGLYASFELRQSSRFPYAELINPFTLYARAMDYLNWRDAPMSSAGRRPLEESSEKMLLVEKVVEENKKATDTALCLKIQELSILIFQLSYERNK